MRLVVKQTTTNDYLTPIVGVTLKQIHDPSAMIYFLVVYSAWVTRPWALAWTIDPFGIKCCVKMGTAALPPLKAACVLSYVQFHASAPAKASPAALQQLHSLTIHKAMQNDLPPTGDRWPYSIIANLQSFNVRCVEIFREGQTLEH